MARHPFTHNPTGPNGPRAPTKRKSSTVHSGRTASSSWSRRRSAVVVGVAAGVVRLVEIVVSGVLEVVGVPGGAGFDVNVVVPLDRPGGLPPAGRPVATGCGCGRC